MNRRKAGFEVIRRPPTLTLSKTHPPTPVRHHRMAAFEVMSMPSPAAIATTGATPSSISLWTEGLVELGDDAPPWVYLVTPYRLDHVGSKHVITAPVGMAYPEDHIPGNCRVIRDHQT